MIESDRVGANSQSRLCWGRATLCFPNSRNVSLKSFLIHTYSEKLFLSSALEQVTFFSSLNHLLILVEIQATLLNSCLILCFSFLLLCMSGFYKLPWAAIPTFLDTTSFSSSLETFLVSCIVEVLFLKAVILSCHLPFKSLASISSLDILESVPL